MLFSVHKLHSYTTELCMFEIHFLQSRKSSRWKVDGEIYCQCHCYTSTSLSTFRCLSVSATINDPRNQTTAPSGSCNSISGYSGFKMFTLQFVFVCFFVHGSSKQNKTQQKQTKIHLFHTRLTHETILNGWIVKYVHNAYLSAPLLIWAQGTCNGNKQDQD